MKLLGTVEEQHCEPVSLIWRCAAEMRECPRQVQILRRKRERHGEVSRLAVHIECCRGPRVHKFGVVNRVDVNPFNPLPYSFLEVDLGRNYGCQPPT